MDKIDRSLLALLQSNGKTSYAALGAEVGLSVSSVNERVRKLVEQGYIKQFSALLDHRTLGLNVVAFVSVQMDHVSSAKQFESAIEALEEVQECHFVTGEYSYLLKVVCQDTRQLQVLIQERIQSLRNVARTNTVIALSSPKLSTVLPTDQLVSLDSLDAIDREAR